jgi:hypothetical protein
MNIALSHLATRTHPQPAAAANQHKLDLTSPVEPFWGPVVIRIATASDQPSLERLAALDSTEVPTGAMLIGELRERPVVAVSLSDGKAVADPFVATTELVELLRLRAGQLNSRERGTPVWGASVLGSSRLRKPADG